MPLFQHHDLIRVLDGAQAVGDDQQGLPFGEGHDRALDFVLIFRIGKRGGFVQNHNGGVLQNGAGDGDTLALPAGELSARLSRRGVPAPVQSGQKLLTLGRPGRRQHLLVRGVRLSQADVLLERAVKEEVVLGDEADGLGELFQRHFPDVPPTQGDGAGRHIPEAGSQPGDGGLAAS